MAEDLKSQNAVSLMSIYAGTLFLIVLVQWGIDDAFTFSDQLMNHTSIMAAITIFGAALSHLLPNSMKHALVFFRIRNVLPGHRCRTLCTKDPRLSMVLLQEKWPELFLEDMEESEQNAYWYSKIYSPVRNTPEVLQAHRSFLLYRDAATALFVLLFSLLVWRCLAIYLALPSLGLSPLFILILLTLLLTQAGRQSGNRMITNAAAVAITETRDNS